MIDLFTKINGAELSRSLLKAVQKRTPVVERISSVCRNVFKILETFRVQQITVLPFPFQSMNASFEFLKFFSFEKKNRAFPSDFPSNKTNEWQGTHETVSMHATTRCSS